MAPQCLATLRRESGGWALPAAVTVGLFALAYGAAWVTYRVAVAVGL